MAPRLQTAPKVEPRVYPAGRAVVLHGVAAPELAGRRLVVEGRRVQAVRFGRLALLIAFVAQNEYADDEVERRRCDVVWLRNEARIHERAVERAATHGTIVPARLLTVFAHPAALEETATEFYARMSRTLTRLGGKNEFALHAYGGPHAPPGGEPYLLRVSARATRAARLALPKVKDDVARELQAILKTCGALATAVRRVEGATARGLLSSVALLVPESESETLKLHVTNASIGASALGVTYYLEGPRAPFSFV
jgi:hypothetical protein